MTDYTNVSKYLSMILRHKPEAIGITLDAHGWADVDKLIQGIAKTYTLKRGRLLPAALTVYFRFFLKKIAALPANTAVPPINGRNVANVVVAPVSGSFSVTSFVISYV